MPGKHHSKKSTVSADPSAPENFRELWLYFGQNRPGLIGFGLSLLQLLIHASWLGFAAWLSYTGQAKLLPPDAWQMWAITLLLIMGTITTAIAMFLSLYGILHGKPKLLAGIGLCASFFIGVFITFNLLLGAAGG